MLVEALRERIKKEDLTVTASEAGRIIWMLERLSQRCAEAYQVVGSLAGLAEVMDDAAVQKALDLFSVPLRPGDVLPEDFTVAVEVRDDLSKDQTLRIATVENLQRQNMTPLEEAGALTKLVHKGVTLALATQSPPDTTIPSHRRRTKRRRPRPVKLVPITRGNLDGRTLAARQFETIVTQIRADTRGVDHHGASLPSSSACLVRRMEPSGRSPSSIASGRSGRSR
jgi:hypothetical protein